MVFLLCAKREPVGTLCRTVSGILLKTLAQNVPDFNDLGGAGEKFSFVMGVKCDKRKGLCSHLV
jgi:hypothetical protein